jgi:hypothetical protein
MHRPPNFFTGNHYFSKHLCPTCLEVTLHLHFKCIHCGHEKALSAVIHPVFKPSKKLKAMDTLRLAGRRVFS